MTFSASKNSKGKLAAATGAALTARGPVVVIARRFETRGHWLTISAGREISGVVDTETDFVIRLCRAESQCVSSR